MKVGRTTAYVTALYIAGKLAVRVKQCPYGASSECHVCVHGYRERTHGPGVRLVVLRCKTHDCAFTVYPLGWYPYGRRPLPCTREELLQVLMGKAEGTFFGALQRLQREPWSSMEGDRRTLRRQLTRAADFVGLTATGESGAVLEALGVGTLQLTEAQKRFAQSSDRHERAKVIVELLDAVATAADGEFEWLTLQRLQHVGYVTGNVGRVWWVQKDSGALYSVFPEGNA